jgi:exodeoxyribonuclease V gamma subunit
VYLDDRPEIVVDREPLELDALQRWALGSLLLDRALEADGDDILIGASLESVWAAVQASGTLPAGTPGRCLFDDLLPDVRALARFTRTSAGGARLDPLELDLEVDGTRIVGQLRDLWPSAQIRSGFSRVQPKHELRAWVAHLALQCAPRVALLPRRTVVVGREREGDGAQQVVFAPLAPTDARARLGEIVALYHLGHRVPLPFFPAASRRYVHARNALTRKRPNEPDAVERQALRVAREVYLPTDYNHQRGEAEDPYVARVFAEHDPIGTEPGAAYQPFDRPLPPELETPSFTALARMVFEPVLAACEGDP